MAEQDTLEMPTDFPRWLTETGIGVSEELVQARWTGVSAVSVIPGRDVTEGLIRLAFGSKQPAAAAMIDRIRQPIYDADNTFEMRGNDKELQILSASALVARTSSEDDLAAETALLVLTTSLAGARKPKLPMDLVSLASGDLASMAEKNRERPTMDSFTVKGGAAVDVKEATTKLQNGDTSGAFLSLASSITNALSKFSTMHAKAMNAVDVITKVQDEELQMLWWLIGERSAVSGGRFEMLPELQRPFLLAKELSDMTVYLPGPLSIEALLMRAHVKDKSKVPLSDAVNAMSDEWISGVLNEREYSPVTTPLHFALLRRQETGAGESWVAGWQAATGLTKMPSMAPLSLGMQFYRENIALQLGE